MSSAHLKEELGYLKRALNLEHKLSSVDLHPTLQPTRCINPGIGGRRLDTVLSRVRSLNVQTNLSRTTEHPVVTPSFGTKFQQRTEDMVRMRFAGDPIDRVNPVNVQQGTLVLSRRGFTGGGQIPSLMSARSALLSKELIKKASVMKTFEGMVVHTKSDLSSFDMSTLRSYAKIVKDKLKKEKNNLVTIHLTSMKGQPVTKENLVAEVLSAYGVLGIITT